MLSINTNISSIVAQRSMTTSTTKLNQAIERLSTGSKINHAADNAANYSIAKNMSTQLSACDVAADNISMGMDLLSVAQDTIAGMQDRGSRIHALITQARNGTYGTDSLNAMTQEANALVSEINRLYINTEYNGIHLFDGFKLPDWAENVKNTAGTIDGKSLEEALAPNASGFIQDIVEETPDVIVTDPTQLASAISSNTKIGIGNAQTLAKLARLVNSGEDCEGKTIILTDDISLADYTDSWVPIGSGNENSDDRAFAGTFNGNGHIISGFNISTHEYADELLSLGLFGVVDGEIKNLGVIGNFNIDMEVGNDWGGFLDVLDCGMLAATFKGTATNCYTKGNIELTNVDYSCCQSVGGFIGCIYGNTDITDCYNAVNISSDGESPAVGGLIGSKSQLIGFSNINLNIDRCFNTGNIYNSGINCAGGIIGGLINSQTLLNLSNSYSAGNITSNNYAFGLAYSVYNGGIINNCYATGNISGQQYAAGLVCFAQGATISNSYCAGNITGGTEAGGLATFFGGGTITNSYTTGNVEGKNYAGGLISTYQGGSSSITNSYSTCSVSAEGYAGGIAGTISAGVTLNNVLAAGDVSGGTAAGNLFGKTLAALPILTNGYTLKSGNIVGSSAGDISSLLENITYLESPDTKLQVGIHGDSDSQVTVNTGLSIDLSISDLTSDSAYNSITNFLNQLSNKATELGAAQNRLESALESNMVQMDNLTSSLSTIRDADISEVSSDFIRQQILQQACATLMSTANQSPSIALQLL